MDPKKEQVDIIEAAGFISENPSPRRTFQQNQEVHHSQESNSPTDPHW